MPEDQPSAEPRYISRPFPVPLPPSDSEVMDIKEEHRERKNVQPYVKHVLEAIKTPHDQVNGGLDLFRGHWFIGYKEGEISVVVLPSNKIFGVDPILLLEPPGQLGAG